MKRTICGLCFALLLTPTSTALAADRGPVRADSQRDVDPLAVGENRRRSAGDGLCVADDEGIKRLVPSDMKHGDAVHVASNFEQAPDRYYIGLRSNLRAGDQQGINPYYNAYWPYVGLTLSSNLGIPLPGWFVS